MESQPQNPENFHIIPWTNGSYHKVTSEWSIVYIEGSKVIISKNFCMFFSEYQFCLGKQRRP